MKKKLIAIVITALLTGGIGGSVVYNKSHDKTTETEVAQVIQEESTSDDSNLDREAEVIESSTDNSNEVVETVVEKDNNAIKEDKQDHDVVQVSQQSSETNKVSVKQNNSSSQPVKNISSNVNNTANNTANSSNVNNTVNSSENFMAQVEQLIYSKVNEQRAANGLSQLSYNDTMQKYARIKSKDMGDNNYFDHKDLNGNLITVKMKNDGVSYNAWAENIAYISGVSDANALANQFMTNWMNSEGHRKNILSTNVNSIGIGVYKIGNKVYATQEFYR